MTEAALPTLPAALCQLVAAVLARACGGDVASLVRVAADEIATRTQSRAISILCTAGGLVHARAGDWPSDARPKLDAWERALVRSARQGATALPDGQIPVSIAGVGGWIVCMAPLAADRQAVGALSLCVEPTREKEAIRTARDLSPWLGAILGLVQGAEIDHRRLDALMAIAGGQPLSGDADEKGWLRKAMRLCVDMLQAEGGLAVVLSETGEHLHCLAADIPNEALDWAGARFKACGMLHHACVSGCTLFSNDPAADARCAADVEGALVQQLQSIVVAPFLTPDGGRGALALFNRRGALGFTARDAELLQSAAGFVSTSFQNASLRRACAETDEKAAAVQHCLRTEIASTMHQGAIQLLAAVTMGMDHLEHLAAVQPEALMAEIKSLKELTREASREARLLLFELHPTSLRSEGLVATLLDYIQQMRGGNDRISLEQGGPIMDIDAPVAEAAFHATVQGIRHALLHGAAARVWLSLSLVDDVLFITIEDNGKPQAERRCARHDQELNCPAHMRLQLALVGGTLDVRGEGPGEKPAYLIQIPARIHG